MIVHQIFGLLGDTEMPDLFKNCQKKVIEWQKKNNYEYMFWTAEMCDKLIEEYPQYKQLYENVRYKIMKVDIIRFIILHKHGGIYIDLDVYPICDRVKSSTFIVAFSPKKTAKPYEMEVLQSVKGHPYNFQFLDYVKTQIPIKDKVEIYQTWKCRYVYQTTGPNAMCRFLHTRDDFDTYILNSPSYHSDKSANLCGQEDFISHISCSYKNRD